jgi:hypothetical protein
MSELELRAALDSIWRIVHTPTSATPHRNAATHYAADFEAIRKIIERTHRATTPAIKP